MINAAVKFLKNNNLTIEQVSKASGMSSSTLSNTFSRPIGSWRLSVINSLAKATNSTPSQVVEAIQSDKWHLELDDKKHLIQGVRIPNYRTYLRLKFVVKNECFEGWRPTRRDILKLVKTDKTPTPLAKSVIKQYLKDAKSL